MTTIRLKFRASTVEGRPGTLYYQLCRKGRSRSVSAGIHIYPGQWTGAEGTLDGYQETIERDIRLLHSITETLEASGKDYSLGDVIERFRSGYSRVNSLRYIEEDIQELVCRGKYGTARNRRRSLTSFAKYLQGKDIPLSEWTCGLLHGYAEWLYGKSLTRNTVSFYMRNLRSVYNKAVKDGLVPQGNPFSNVYTGTDRTSKRAVDESVMLRLKELDLSCAPALELARDMFLFSYCTRGMTFIDMVFLRREDIRGGSIVYRRRKTGQKLRIRIETCIGDILKKYGRKRQDSPYVFPVIRSQDIRAAYSEYQTALGYYNRKLKRLSSLLNLDTPLSSHVARHSWATAARNRNTPIAVISSGMGHTSERTTRIYLAALDESLIDSANRSILAPLERSARLSENSDTSSSLGM